MKQSMLQSLLRLTAVNPKLAMLPEVQQLLKLPPPSLDNQVAWMTRNHSECLTFSYAKPMKLTKTKMWFETIHLKVYRPKVLFLGCSRIAGYQAHRNTVIVKITLWTPIVKSWAPARTLSLFNTQCFSCGFSVESNKSPFFLLKKKAFIECIWFLLAYIVMFTDQSYLFDEKCLTWKLILSIQVFGGFWFVQRKNTWTKVTGPGS